MTDADRARITATLHGHINEYMLRVKESAARGDHVDCNLAWARIHALKVFAEDIGITPRTALSAV